MMADKENTNISFSSNNWYRKPTAALSEVRFQIHGEQYCLDRKLLTAKSGKFAALLKNHKNEELAYTFKNIPGDSTTFALVMKFCYGNELKLTSVNVVPLICLAFYLDMTEYHCKGNLLNIALCFFYSKILPAWNEAVKAFRTTELVFDEASHLGLVDSCLESLL
ncbi:BTB/POZ domain-containing protein At5g17580-like isoform X2 [Papaver somniferum]|uniref:BTB/POZ domain-containing protein At5g17580-like isoform X2 n=1 Tax=Papaver somniferum TaxID=3469 RepID=UPI000E6FA3FE|nr:BTB/POZ domain-containing protein At5g17580-like isoform X2 [Papaver somniferum]